MKYATPRAAIKAEVLSTDDEEAGVLCTDDEDAGVLSTDNEKDDDEKKVPAKAAKAAKTAKSTGWAVLGSKRKMDVIVKKANKKPKTKYVRNIEEVVEENESLKEQIRGLQLANTRITQIMQAVVDDARIMLQERAVKAVVDLATYDAVRDAIDAAIAKADNLGESDRAWKEAGLGLETRDLQWEATAAVDRAVAKLNEHVIATVTERSPSEEEESECRRGIRVKERNQSEEEESECRDETMKDKLVEDEEGRQRCEENKLTVCDGLDEGVMGYTFDDFLCQPRIDELCQ